MSKKRVFDIIQIGKAGDIASKVFDFYVTVAILFNLFIVIFDTFEESEPYMPVLKVIELITILGFTIEYILRVWTAEYLYPDRYPYKARIKYILSASGIVDLLTFFPYYLPFFFPSGAVAFRIFRVVRIFRLFRINAYYDALNVIGDVFKRKKNQIISSIFIIGILIIASSLCMYSLEHEAQPDVFKNAFSGIWWSVSTLMTIGYGDIYPITTAGKVFSILITFLGVGMVAIPTGILSAGFVEQYTILKDSEDYFLNRELRFLKISISEKHPWIDKKVCELGLPPGILIAGAVRRGETIIPNGNMVICKNDIIVIGAQDCDVNLDIKIKHIGLTAKHPWVGHAVKELDISRHTLIVMIRRNNEAIVPAGDTRLMVGDEVYVFSKKYILDAETMSV